MNAVTNNPVTATAAAGLIIQSILGLFNASAEVQLAAAQITLGAAVLIRLGFAWWERRHPKLDDESGEITIGQVLIVAGILAALVAVLGAKAFDFGGIVLLGLAAIFIGIGALAR